MTDPGAGYSPANQLLDRARAGDLRAATQLSLGQQRMAFLLASEAKHELLFCKAYGWMSWTGTHWAPDDGFTARGRLNTVLMSARSDMNPETSKAAASCMSAAGHKGILEIASYLPEFHVRLEDLDDDPYLLNLANGTYDLRTGQLRDHDPADRITKITRAAYRPDAEGPHWAEHLEYFQPDAQIRAFLQRFFGYSLLGKVVEHILLIAYGPKGANGKSTTDRAIQHALGDYATTANQNLLVATRANSADAPSPARFALLGRRYVAMSETEKRAPIAEALMKNLTGGDKVSARALHKDEITFDPSHTMVLFTNHKPKLSGDDSGVWRRVKLVPFEVTRPVDQWDNHIDDKLQLEADAILTWMLAGYHDWDDRGLRPPQQVEAATAEYQYEEDSVSQFLTERLVPDRSQTTPSREIWEEWQAFAHENHCTPIQPKDLYLRLETEGYERKKRKTGYVFMGVAVQQPAPEVPDEELIE